MNNSPLVSVIVPTYNSDSTLEACLQSIKDQTYINIEIVVVDNHSSDSTPKIAKQSADKFYTKGPERSAQVNYGVEKSLGEYVYKVDSDFVLDKTVIEECITEIKKGYDAIVIHNSPDITVSWIAKIRKFEVDMYKYDLVHSSSRFLKKEVYIAIAGFNPAITAGEDYDFQNKLNRAGFKTGFINAEALHLGEPKKLWPHLKKYYEYGKDFNNYKSENIDTYKQQLGFFRHIYFKNYTKFLRNPYTAILFIIYNTMKFTAGGLGLTVSVLKTKMFDSESNKP